MRKIIRSLLSLAMVLTMVLAMSTVAFAVDGYNTNDGKDSSNPLTDTTKFTFTKNYTLEGSATGVSPAEDFKVTIMPFAVKNAPEGVTVSNMPVFTGVPADQDDGVIILSAEAGAAQANGTVTVDINLPEYTDFGDYWYKVNEEAGSTAGVTYESKTFYLHVQVVKEEGELIRLVTLHAARMTAVAGEDPWLNEKAETVSNSYYNGSVSIKKEVTGSFGDHDKEFTVQVSFSYPSANSTVCPVKSAIKFNDDIQDNEKKTLSDWTYNGESKAWVTSQEITLKHGETVTFENLPYGVTYTVRENNYYGEGYEAPDYGFSSGNGYGTEAHVTDLVHGDKWENKYAAGTVSDALDLLSIKNLKNATIDVGVTLDDAPFFLMFVVVAASAAAYFVIRRKYAKR